MFVQPEFTFGLLFRSVSIVMLAAASIESQPTPDWTTVVTSQSWPVIPKHRGSPSARLLQSELILSALTCANWNLNELCRHLSRS